MQQPDEPNAGHVRPRVLFVYYSYTHQTANVVAEMSEVLRERGCDVQQAAIQFSDPRYAQRFSGFPFRHLYRDLFGMVPAQLRSATGQIEIPAAAQEGDYDLVCIGSPTWWMKTSMPIRSYLKSDAAGRVLQGKRFTAFVICRRYWSFNLHGVRNLGQAQGGDYIDGTHWTFSGGQIRSLLSLLSYLGSGENRGRYLRVKIPPTNLHADDLQKARAFAGGLADRFAVA